MTAQTPTNRPARMMITRADRAAIRKLGLELVAGKYYTMQEAADRSGYGRTTLHKHLTALGFKVTNYAVPRTWAPPRNVTEQELAEIERIKAELAAELAPVPVSFTSVTFAEQVQGAAAEVMGAQGSVEAAAEALEHALADSLIQTPAVDLSKPLPELERALGLGKLLEAAARALELEQLERAELGAYSAELETDVKILRAEVGKTMQEVAERDQLIKVLRGDLAAAEAEITELKEGLDLLDGYWRKAVAEIESLRGQVSAEAMQAVAEAKAELAGNAQQLRSKLALVNGKLKPWGGA